MGKRRIIAGMATIPERTSAMMEAVESLLPQVDTIYVYANGFANVSHLYKITGYNPKVVFFDSKEFLGDLGDAGKLLMATKEFCPISNGYFFSVDDDIIYPRDYVMYLISKMKKWDDRKVVGFHGKLFDPPISSFYRDRINVDWYHWRQPLVNDTPVHMLGTGLMAFPMEAVRISAHDLMSKPCNAADIHFAIACQKSRTGMVCVSHSTNHIRLSDKIDHVNDTIYGKTRNNDHAHTEAINARPWHNF